MPPERHTITRSPSSIMLEVSDRFAHLPPQALGELAELVVGFARVAMELNGLWTHARVGQISDEFQAGNAGDDQQD